MIAGSIEIAAIVAAQVVPVRGNPSATVSPGLAEKIMVKENAVLESRRAEIGDSTSRRCVATGAVSDYGAVAYR